MNGITFIRDDQEARKILLDAGILDQLPGNLPTDRPRCRAALHRTPHHHVLGLRFTGSKRKSDDGLAVILGDRGSVSPERWAVMVTRILQDLGAVVDARMFESFPGKN